MTSVIGPPPSAPAAAPANPSVPEPQAPAENAAVIAPPEADAGTSFIDPAALNEVEAQLLESFQNRQSQSNRPSAPGVTPAEPSSEIDSTAVVGGEQGGVISPAVPPTPPAAPQPEPTTVPAEVTAPAVTPQPETVAPASPTPVGETPYDPYAIPAPPAAVAPVVAPEAQATLPAQPAPPGYVDFMGQSMPVAQAQQMQQTYQWAQALTPEESNAINQFIQQNRQQQAPGAVTPPIQQAPQPIQYPGAVPPAVAPPYQPQQPPGPLAPPPPAPPDFSQLDVDPAVAAYLQQQAQYQASQQAVIAQQQATLAQMAPALAQTQQMSQAAFQSQQAAANAETNTQLDQARWDFATKYQLSSAQMEIIESRLTQSNLVPELVNRKNGDVYAGITDGFETVAWTAPDIRAQLLAAQVAPAIDDAREIQQRAARLGSLAGQGGAVPTNQGVPATPQERHAGMVAVLRTAMEQNPQ